MDEYPLALVTGAAHRLGRIFALTLARKKYTILLHYHGSSDAARKTADEIRAMGSAVHPLKADLTDTSQINSLFSSIDELGIPLRVLINSASEMMRSDLRSISSIDFDRSMNLNLRAPLLIAKGAAERMKEGGLIVNISDAGVGKLWTGYPAYMISKSGLETLTRLQAKLYAPNIRVNAIAPGLILKSQNIEQAEWDRLASRLPLKHVPRVEDIASALEFLLENQSLTGQTIVVDSGYSLL